MAELADIRAGLAANLRARFPDAQCTGYLLSNPTAPSFEIELGDDGVDYHEAMQNGVSAWSFTVRGFVASNLDIGAQKKLDVWAQTSGADSVKAAIESDRTLGGAAFDLLVVSMSPFQAMAARDGSGTYLGATWTVRVVASG